MEQHSTPVLVVITYLPVMAQGIELTFAIEGWRRHFKEDYRIVIAGGHLPNIKGDDIVLVDSPRIPEPEGQYWAHCDYVSCLKKVRALYPDHDGFIFVADDCYAVNDFTLADVKVTKMLPSPVNFDPQSSNGWRRDKMKTKARVMATGVKHYCNYTTHLPIWYDWKKVEALWEKYDMERESYVLEDLYFNLFENGGKADVLTGRDRWKCGMYDDAPAKEKLLQATRSKVWITNSPVGYTPELEKFLVNYYNI